MSEFCKIYLKAGLLLVTRYEIKYFFNWNFCRRNTCLQNQMQKCVRDYVALPPMTIVLFLKNIYFHLVERQSDAERLFHWFTS